MQNYKQITYRYLKGQRNRTILTIIGIILSVAMVSAIGTIIISARGALIKEAIRENGTYFARFRNVEKENIDKIINHIQIDKSGISQNQGFGIVTETTDADKKLYGQETPSYRTLEIEGFKQEALDLLPYKIKEGRFPMSSYEIAIDPSTATYFENEVKIGDKINLNIGDLEYIEHSDSEVGNSQDKFEQKFEREYTVVGFIQTDYRWGGNFQTKGITTLDDNSPEVGKYNVYFTLPSVKNANDKIFSIAKDVGVDEVNIKTNYRLLRLSAESLNQTFNNSIMALLAFIIILIVVSTIAVIYNAFNISVLERVSQFGLLRSVGATPNQIQGIVLKEAFILSAIGIPIGLFSGVLAMKIVFYIIALLKSSLRFVEDMEIAISGLVFLFSTIIGLITVYLSAIGPARKAGKISPLEAVRNTGSFKKESFDKIKKSSFIRNILGIEGEIAYKNLRRNRKRFLITVFSMVISISLFITFSTFSDFMFKMGVVQGQDVGEFSIYGRVPDNIYKEVKEIKDVNRVYKVNQTNGKALISENRISKKIKEMQPNNFTNTVDGLVSRDNINVYTIGDENFEVLKGLLKEGVINKNELDSNNGVLVINSTYAYNENTKNHTLLEGYSIKTGDKIPYSSYDSDQEGVETEYIELNVMGVLDRGMLDNVYDYNGGFSIITTEKVLNSISEGSSKYTNLFIEMTEDGDLGPMKTYLDELKVNNLGLDYIDYAEYAREVRISSIVTSIFLYGFVTLIALISAINIINTISTNIILRTKEISMIKAVGMTQSGIRRMVALESLYYGIYAAIFGGALGTGLTFILFKIVFNIREFQWTMPWKNIAIACIGATIVALLSGMYPLRRINEGIIVENMKVEN